MKCNMIVYLKNKDMVSIDNVELDVDTFKEYAEYFAKVIENNKTLTLNGPIKAQLVPVENISLIEFVRQDEKQVVSSTTLKVD